MKITIPLHQNHKAVRDLLDVESMYKPMKIAP